ncbi:MAG: BatA and WFA domain-containing protein [Phycisphaeraceae bacterium]|nr:BatA and WFA domain-containing protein [Phycisphaeraceae bacterium]
MTFLAPTSALVAAALVLPALFAMYLLKLRRRPLRVSSIMLWPEAATDVQVNVPLAPPRPSWLMLLHLLIAMALIAAVGRPAIFTSGAGAGTLLLLIDRSASMSAMDGMVRGSERISRLEEAKQRARETIERAPALTRFAVVSIAAAPEIVREFSNDAAGAIAAINRIAPTDQPGDLGAAMQVARALLGSAGSSEQLDAGVDVLVFSDGSFADGTREVVAPGGAVRLIRCGPAPAVEKSNLGIVVLSARRDAERPEVVHLFAKVQNAGTTARSVPIRLSVDANVIETRAVLVPGSTPQEPGEVGVVFPVSAPAGGMAMVSLLVDDQRDLLSSDNSAAINLRSAAPLRILLVQRGAGPRLEGEPSPALTADFLLADAIAELSPGATTRVDRGRYEELVAGGELKFYDLVVFDNVSPRVAPSLPSLSFGAGVPGLELGPSIEIANARPIQSWQRSSPFLRDITLDGVVIDGERAFQGRNADVLARSERGPLILLSKPDDGPRRLVVTFALENSNWPLQAGFPIFLKSAADLLTSRGAENAGTQFVTTQTVIFQGIGNPPDYVGPVPVLARLAPGQSENTSADAVRRMTLGVLDRVGVYTPVASPGFPPIAVNLLNSHESEVATSDSLRIGSQTIAANTSVVRPQELWWWALVIASALLVVEWAVFARSARL